MTRVTRLAWERPVGGDVDPMEQARHEARAAAEESARKLCAALTPPECALLVMICNGANRRECASGTGVSIKRVESRLADVRIKLDVSTTLEAAVIFTLAGGLTS